MSAKGPLLSILRTLSAGAILAMGASVHAAETAPAIDLGTSVPEAAAVKEGLFPDDACKELEANGFRCMGLKPAVRFSLPAASFKLGSAELPEGLRKQLDVFADVLRGRPKGSQGVRIIGHADASGSAAGNLALSLKRAESVKAYLVSKGADPASLQTVGLGAKEPKNAQNPAASENRRVEIGRAE
ncbi:OmpA family protein [Piscinibacter sp. Jin2]|uniref:OmpA family protein n=1 Tax=Aquariibacter lacus TaxID=2801332 RepID=A0A9X1BQ38_9BURK|nr:OmpA family protein [Piscinibacter lacus]MBL0718399.1 OmpA family protein [Piscinibacter lacus]